MSAASFWVASDLRVKASLLVSEEPARCVGPLTVERALDFITVAFRVSLILPFLPPAEPGRFFEPALLLVERDFFRLAIVCSFSEVLQCHCALLPAKARYSAKPPKMRTAE
jgi:hypothetical protein